jgi:hypothetical protein
VRSDPDEVDVLPGEPLDADPRIRDRESHPGEPGLHIRRGRPRRIARRFPRKEVIQPQLPLRLPCYDFTPVTGSAFDRSLPCGLGHGLRAFPTSVV